MRVAGNRQFQHSESMMRSRHQPLRFMRRLPGGHKYHPGKIERGVNLFGNHQVPVMYRVEGASKYAYAPRRWRCSIVFQRFTAP
jgi:hypothetical protein